VPGAALASHSGPLTCGAWAREIDGLVVRVKVTIDLIAPLDQTVHAVQGYGILLLVATRGPWVPGALHPPGPLTCGARRAREIDGLVVRVKVTIDLRSRPNECMPCRGYGILSTSSLTRGPWVSGAAPSHSGPLTCEAHQGLEKLMGWLCGSKFRFTIAPDQTNACRAGAMELLVA
jgi:hypothetical protein